MSRVRLRGRRQRRRPLPRASAVVIAGLTAFTRSPFLAFFVGLFTIGAAFALWIELLMREAAVYVIVLMLPLAFAAMVWPARRIWAIRAVELLVALILSKFAIVAVLSLGGAAISAGSAAGGSITAVIAGRGADHARGVLAVGAAAAAARSSSSRAERPGRCRCRAPLSPAAPGDAASRSAERLGARPRRLR